MFSRYTNNPKNTINLTIDGQDTQAQDGDSVAAAALSQGLSHTRRTPVSGAARAPFCLMGVCYDCLMTIDGVPNQRACMTTVKAGMAVQTQLGAGHVDESE